MSDQCCICGCKAESIEGKPDATFARHLDDGRAVCGYRCYEIATEWAPRLVAAKHDLSTRLQKRSGAQWHGTVCGIYSTSLTPIGYAVESEREPGSVQIYPEAALEPADG